jgi:hypothetical protein
MLLELGEAELGVTEALEGELDELEEAYVDVDGLEAELEAELELEAEAQEE